MKCTNCGFETNENIQFCPVCGTAMPKIDNVVVSENVGNFSIPTPPSTNAYTPQSGNYVPNLGNNNYYSQQKAEYTSDQKVNNYLTLNVVFLVLNAITLCFCCGAGWLLISQILVLSSSVIVSIIGVAYSSKVNKMIKAGNIQVALETSKVAKSLFFIGMILLIIKVILAVIGFVIIISAVGGFDAWWQSIMDAANQGMHTQTR